MTRDPTTTTERSGTTTERRTAAERRPTTERRRTTEHRYTDAENTGTAAVPDLRRHRDSDRGSDRDTRREDMDELVWSHRL